MEIDDLESNRDRLPQRLAWVAIGVVCLWFGGCGGAESTVSGIVTLDGTPLETGTVSVVPVTGAKGLGASGLIEEGGEYSIRVGQTNGLPAGEYNFRVISLGSSKPSSQGGPPAPGKLLIPKRYTSAATSKLRFTVEPGSNTINLELATTNQ